MDFVALDVETANPDMASICQIGIAHFSNWDLTDSWSSLINPEDYFDDMNVMIHGIEQEHVRNAPTFAQASAIVRDHIAGKTVVIHTWFDKRAVLRASEKYQLTAPDCIWLDSSRVARRAWPEVAYKGYGLGNLAAKLHIAFQHHDALEDARAAGLVLLHAITATGLDLAGWIKRIEQPINPSYHYGKHSREGNPEGPLSGEMIVFTGSLNLVREEAAILAAKAGCTVADGVTKNTTLLVVGDQDYRKLADHEKSAKHRKAEQWILKGKPIRILGECDFLALVGQP